MLKVQTSFKVIALLFSISSGVSAQTSPLLSYGFEQGFNLSYGEPANIVSGQSYSGSYSYRLFSGGAGIGIMDKLVKGNTYRISGYFKQTVAGENGTFGIRFRDSNGATIMDKQTWPSSLSYQKSSIDVTVPANATDAGGLKSSASAVVIISAPVVVTPPPAPVASALHHFGVNLAGAEFGDSRNFTHGSNYIYPSASDLDYFNSKGLKLIRLPFKWERLQRSLYAPLDAGELSLIKGVSAAAAARGMKLVLDVHNYGRYKLPNGVTYLIGSPEVPYAAFKDFWAKVAAQFKNDSGIYAYDIMNEPHDMNGLWPAGAQAAVDGIRSADMGKQIQVEGDCWSGAHSWQRCNANLRINDSAKNFIFHAHQYFDNDSSGTYNESYDSEGAHPGIGVDRLRPFVEWLKANGYKGFIGEYGVPKNDSRWNVVLDNALKYMYDNCLSGTYWAAGPWWGDYALSVQPANGVDKPQMQILQEYTKPNPVCQ